MQKIQSVRKDGNSDPLPPPETRKGNKGRQSFFLAFVSSSPPLKK